MLSEIVKRCIPCLNPRRVYNPYIEDYLVVKCGKCAQCKNIAAFVAQKSCEYEAMHHRFTFFCTLSYSEENLPRVRFEKVIDDTFVSSPTRPVPLWYKDPQKVYRIIDDCPRSKTYGELVGHITHNQLYKTQRRRYNPYKNMDSPISYCLHYDLQKFIKRVRYTVKKASGENIRYYAVSDYGGKYLRPHYHILFYFDKNETFSMFRETTIKQWWFGNVKCEKSRGFASSYVSSYITGSLLRLPLYNTPFFKVRSFHSNRFGIQVLLPLRDRIYNSATLPFDGSIYKMPDGTPVEFYPTSLLHRTFYPKIYGFGTLSFENLFRLYTLRFNIGGSSFCDFLVRFQSHLCKIPLYQRNHWRDLLHLDDSFFEYPTIDQLEGTTLLSRLRQIYSVGGHFHFFVCDGKEKNHARMLRVIVDYYKRFEEDKFHKFLEALESQTFLMKNMGDSLLFLYPNSFSTHDSSLFDKYKDGLRNTSCYSIAQHEASQYAQNRIKHREHTDDRFSSININI